MTLDGHSRFYQHSAHYLMKVLFLDVSQSMAVHLRLTARVDEAEGVPRVLH